MSIQGLRSLAVAAGCGLGIWAALAWCGYHAFASPGAKPAGNVAPAPVVETAPVPVLADVKVALVSKVARERQSAVASMAQLRTEPTALDELEKALADADIGVRAEAVYAVAVFLADEKQAARAKALIEAAQWDKDANVAREARYVLGVKP
jgi:HEAT repeat protein